MYEGRVVGVVCSQDFDITQIGLMMTGTHPQDLPGKGQSEEFPAQSADSSFDEVLEGLRHYEEAAQTEPPKETEISSESEGPLEEPPQLEPPTQPDEPLLNLSEKERVLRKVLGEKYKQGDEE